MDKGYTEVLTDSDGNHHGTDLGRCSPRESDRLKERNRRRAKLRSIANQAAQRGNRAKADRIHRNNLGTVKRDRQAARWRARVRTETFTAVHAVVDKAATVVAEDLTKTFAGRKRLGKDMNRRLAAWTKGVTAEALKNVSERRGSALVLVNAAYTSQVVPAAAASPPQRGSASLHQAGSCGRQTMPPRSTSCNDMAIPTSPCTPRTSGSSRSCRNGPTANGSDCRSRTPAEQQAAESESSDLLSNEQLSRKQLS